MSDIALPPSPAQSENAKYHTFINVAMFLAAITGVELVLVYLPFDPTFILWTLVILSLIKFFAVIAWFMHLVYDKLLLTIVFAAGLILATGTVIALMFIMGPKHVDFQSVEIAEAPETDAEAGP